MFLLSISQTAFSQSDDSSKESKSKSSSTEQDKDDSKKDNDDEEAKKRKASDDEAAKKTILHRVGEKGDKVGSLKELFSKGGGRTHGMSLDEVELSGEGTLNPKRVKFVVGRDQIAVENCAGEKKPEPGAARFSVEVTIDRSGKVIETAISDNDFDDEFDACVLSIAQSWSFPRPKGGTVKATIHWTPWTDSGDDEE
ncbi:MAG: AgmX/PglI C-terminal domain-containing protein [Persicimonas sp.]